MAWGPFHTIVLAAGRGLPAQLCFRPLCLLLYLWPLHPAFRRRSTATDRNVMTGHIVVGLFTLTQSRTHCTAAPASAGTSGSSCWSSRSRPRCRWSPGGQPSVADRWAGRSDRGVRGRPAPVPAAGALDQLPAHRRGLKHKRYLYLARAGPYVGEDRHRVGRANQGLISQEHAKWTSSQQPTERPPGQP